MAKHLLAAVALAHGHRGVLQRPVVHRARERHAQLVCARVPLAHGHRGGVQGLGPKVTQCEDMSDGNVIAAGEQLEPTYWRGWLHICATYCCTIITIQ